MRDRTFLNVPKLDSTRQRSSRAIAFDVWPEWRTRHKGYCEILVGDMRWYTRDVEQRLVEVWMRLAFPGVWVVCHREDRWKLSEVCQCFMRRGVSLASYVVGTVNSHRCVRGRRAWKEQKAASDGAELAKPFVQRHVATTEHALQAWIPNANIAIDPSLCFR